MSSHAGCRTRSCASFSSSIQSRAPRASHISRCMRRLIRCSWVRYQSYWYSTWESFLFALLPASSILEMNPALTTIASKLYFLLFCCPLQCLISSGGELLISPQQAILPWQPDQIWRLFSARALVVFSFLHDPWEFHAEEQQDLCRQHYPAGTAPATSGPLPRAGSGWEGLVKWLSIHTISTAR